MINMTDCSSAIASMDGGSSGTTNRLDQHSSGMHATLGHARSAPSPAGGGGLGRGWTLRISACANGTLRSARPTLSLALPRLRGRGLITLRLSNISCRHFPSPLNGQLRCYNTVNFAEWRQVTTSETRHGQDVVPNSIRHSAKSNNLQLGVRPASTACGRSCRRGAMRHKRACSHPLGKVQ